MSEQTPDGAVLELEDVHTYYGAIHAIKGVTLEVRQGEIVTLLGANGAGKSTTLRSINGLNHPRRGRIRFQGKDITYEAPHEIVAKGVAQSPEGRKLFPRMTVLENLEMGAFQRKDKSGLKEDLERVFHLFPRLAERKSQKAGTMSGGEQQMCAIGRALMAHPKLLLLDEPSMGLAPIFVEKIFEIIIEINKQGTPILLVEQNALMALDVAQRGYVLETGKVALADDARALRENEDVRKTYLGERVAPADLGFWHAGLSVRYRPEGSRAARAGIRLGATRRRCRAPSAVPPPRRASARTRAAARRPSRGSRRPPPSRAARAQACMPPSPRTAAAGGTSAPRGRRGSRAGRRRRRARPPRVAPCPGRRGSPGRTSGTAAASGARSGGGAG